MLKNRLAEKNIQLVLTDEGCRYIVDNSFDPAYGARPIRRFIQRTVETDIGRLILKGDIRENSVVEVTADENGLKYDTK